MPVYRDAKFAMWYVDVRDEVRTRAAIRDSLGGPVQVVVPWCDGMHLQLFRLREMADLETGRFGILEPKASLRRSSQHRVSAEEIDVILVPGVAFDANGGRLGHGAGFYDRFFSRCDGVRVGLAYECQLVDAIPMADHDVRVDWLVTETQVRDCRGGLGVHAGDSAC